MQSFGNPNAKKILMQIYDKIERSGHHGKHKNWEILIELLADYNGMIVTEYDDYSCDPEIEDLLMHYKIAAQKAPWDYIGEVLEEIGLTNERSGQFFTPRNIVTMMIKMTMPDKYEKPQTILEPCLGTGRFLIELSNIFPNAPLILFGVERDISIYRASIVNMKMFSKHPYAITCADSLRLESSSPMSPMWNVSTYWTGEFYNCNWNPDMTPFYFNPEKNKPKPVEEKKLQETLFGDTTVLKKNKKKKISYQKIEEKTDEKQEILCFG